MHRECRWPPDPSHVGHGKMSSAWFSVARVGERQTIPRVLLISSPCAGRVRYVRRSLRGPIIDESKSDGKAKTTFSYIYIYLVRSCTRLYTYTSALSFVHGVCVSIPFTNACFRHNVFRFRRYSAAHERLFPISPPHLLTLISIRFIRGIVLFVTRNKTTGGPWRR